MNCEKSYRCVDSPDSFVYELMVISIRVLSIPFGFLFLGCQPTNTSNSDPVAPIYSNPVWAPDGLQLACKKLSTDSKPGGLVSVSPDGAVKAPVVQINTSTAAWSPDFRWLGFSNGQNLFRIAYTGQKFDSNSIEQLTFLSGNAFHLSWSRDSKSIFFDVLNQKNEGTGIFKLILASKKIDTLVQAADSITGVSDPYVADKNQLLYIRTLTDKKKFIIADTLGKAERTIDVPEQLAFPLTQPQLFRNRIYCGSFGIWSVPLDGSPFVKLFDTYYYGFSLSQTGEICFINDTDHDPAGKRIPDSEVGQIWVMQPDGSGARALTHSIQ